MGTRLYVTDLGPYVSEGSRLLWRHVQKRSLSLAEAGRMLGISVGLIGRWIRGQARPGGRGRALLHDWAGINPSTWDEAPRKPFSLEASAA
jgi:transcriptional regulator with XRE-family HTH domain